MTLAHFPLNPGYGTGCYRRLLRFRAHPNGMLATVDDTHHAMWLLLRHKGGLITAIEAAISRGPATSCTGSIAGLQALVGLPVAAERGTIIEALTPTGNCTHLIDLAIWSMRAATSGSTHDHAIRVADDDGAPYTLDIHRDGELVHQWLASRYTVIDPAPLAGMPLMRGFMARARAHFSGDALEAAQMLQRGVFVARGRRHLVDLSPPTPLRAAKGMEDACHSYAGAQWRTAYSHVGYVRDFTDGVRPHPLPDRLAPLLQGPSHDHD